MNRRRLIKLAALPLVGLFLPVAWRTSLRADALRADALFEDLFGDAGLAAEVGFAHRRADPKAGARGKALINELSAYDATSRARHLDERIVSDLETLDVVVVDGWVMARAEADFCATVHLDRSSA